jgi:hypothetical protein
MDEILAPGPGVPDFDNPSPPGLVHRVLCVPVNAVPGPARSCQNSWRISTRCVAPSGANRLENRTKLVTRTRPNSVSA